MNSNSRVPAELLSVGVARRMRRELGERRISGAEFGRMVGMTQSTVSRRLAGDAAFTLDELEHIEAVTGISVKYLVGLADSADVGQGNNG